MAVLSFAVIGGIAIGGTPEFIALSAGLAILTGIVLTLAGLLKLGVLADFLSKPVLGGFIIGLATTSAFGQVGKIVGYNVEADGFFKEVVHFVLEISRLHIPTLIVGVTSLALLFLMHAYTLNIPAAITVLILSMHWNKPSKTLNQPPLRMLRLPTIDTGCASRFWITQKTYRDIHVAAPKTT